MNITDKNTLKSWFLRGMKPLETQFAAWIDAYWHKSEQIPTSSINGLEATLNSKAETADLQAHRDDRANPHQVDKTQIGLPNVDNTADAYKPLSLPQREAMDEMRNNLEAKIDKHIKNVAYNTATATFTFTFEDNTTAEIDTPIENTVKNGHFDAIANELVLTLTSDEEIRIPAAGLIKVYTGKETSTTTTSVDANGEISVDIKQACIDTAHLSDTLKGEINNHLTKTGDTKHNIVTFAEADTRSNLSSGDTHAAAFGKIKRNITDLHPVAFSGLATDLTDDAAHRFITDNERTAWHSKAEASHVHDYYLDKTDPGQQTVNGYVNFAAGSGSTSDIRFKDNIKPLPDILEIIANLDLFAYRWNKPDEIHYSIGLSAQQLSKHFPELVHKANDEKHTLSVQYDKLAIIALQGIKELKKQIDTLKK